MSFHIMITGASSGVGRALAIQLSLQGHRLSLCGLTEEKLADTLHQLDESSPVYSDVFCLSEHRRIEQFVDQAKSELGTVDMLVNCAGVNSSRAKAESPDWLALEHMMKINFYAPLKLTQLLIPEMRLQKSGVILNVLSTTCLFSNPAIAQYTASKSALDSYSKVLRKELNLSGVKVLSLYAGGIDTDFREAQVWDYLSAEDVANTIQHMLFSQANTHVHELVMRPAIEQNFS